MIDLHNNESSEKKINEMMTIHIKLDYKSYKKRNIKFEIV